MEASLIGFEFRTELFSRVLWMVKGSLLHKGVLLGFFSDREGKFYIEPLLMTFS